MHNENNGHLRFIVSSEFQMHRKVSESPSRAVDSWQCACSQHSFQKYALQNVEKWTEFIGLWEKVFAGEFSTVEDRGFESLSTLEKFYQATMWLCSSVARDVVMHLGTYGVEVAWKYVDYYGTNFHRDKSQGVTFVAGLLGFSPQRLDRVAEYFGEDRDSIPTSYLSRQRLKNLENFLQFISRGWGNTKDNSKLTGAESIGTMGLVHCLCPHIKAAIFTLRAWTCVHAMYFCESNSCEQGNDSFNIFSDNSPHVVPELETDFSQDEKVKFYSLFAQVLCSQALEWDCGYNLARLLAQVACVGSPFFRAKYTE